ncbi:hemagglutinin repeat-containing protein [Enterobacteriaceae bacterium]
MFASQFYDAGQRPRHRDTALAGAQVNGSQVTADVGRDLTIASRQDIDNYI